jgi:CHASE2 domain-containing sensor protein
LTVKPPYQVQTWFAIAITSITILGVLLGLRQFGGLQPLELLAYDQMVRLRPDSAPDPRLLIVTITEADIHRQKRFPLSDLTVATALQRIQRYQPRVIGLDLYRDLPQEPGNRDLALQLHQPNVIVITKIPDAEELGVLPPPDVPSDRAGFNDLVSDPDGVVRRSLLFADTETSTLYSFSLRLTLVYLQSLGIRPESGRANPANLRLGKTEFIPLKANSGGYQTIDANGYQIALTYRARRNLAHQVTLTQVLNGELHSEWVKDKIVLIGTTARSAKDLFLTPYSAAEKESPKMPGVLIHAQMVSQFLSVVLDRQPLMSVWSERAEILWLLGWMLVGGGLAWVLRSPLALGLLEAIAVLVLLGICYGAFLQQVWIPVVAPTGGLLVTVGVVIAYRAQQAQRQQQLMLRLLGQNTSPEIADTLWNSRDRLLKSGKLPGQRLVATMMFTDIRSFSAIAEQLSPENLLDWLNEYLNAITQEVQAHHGIVNKFTGDGMLASFGVPVNRVTSIEVSQDAQLAVSCALAMRDRLHDLNQDWQKRGLSTIQMRVGIFTGAVVAGSLGGRDRLEYGVIGDSVNIASRLESYDKTRQSDDCRILIAKETLVHVQGKFAVEHWGHLALSGKQQMVDVYRILGRIEEDSDSGMNAPVCDINQYPHGNNSSQESTE